MGRMFPIPDGRAQEDFRNPFNRPPGRADWRAMTDAQTDEFVAFANRLADAAGDVARAYFRRDLAVEYKAANSPVTEADNAVETRLREIIAAAYPDHGLIGEEQAPVNPEAEFVWVIDPIDGTQLFITGVPMFTCLIALMRGARPLIGVIDQPVIGDRWVGAAGRQTTFNGSPARTRPRLRSHVPPRGAGRHVAGGGRHSRPKPTIPGLSDSFLTVWLDRSGIECRPRQDQGTGRHPPCGKVRLGMGV